MPGPHCQSGTLFWNQAVRGRARLNGRREKGADRFPEDVLRDSLVERGWLRYILRGGLRGFKLHQRIGKACFQGAKRGTMEAIAKNLFSSCDETRHGAGISATIGSERASAGGGGMVLRLHPQ